MKKIFLLLSIIFAVAACSKKDYFKITGELPDKSFDGEKIYFVPLINAPLERVDSTVIKNGQFTFEGHVDSTEIYIIRGRPLVRLSLQELLIVKEPGIINANLNHNSFAGGTALNDSLEHWKQKKITSEILLVNCRTKYNATADTIQQALFKQQADSLKKGIASFNYNFVKNNQTNVVGEMVYKFTKKTFTPEQIKIFEFDK
jgi:hypothetical protein